jgi:hypothetical protein
VDSFRYLCKHKKCLCLGISIIHTLYSEGDEWGGGAPSLWHSKKFTQTSIIFHKFLKNSSHYSHAINYKMQCNKIINYTIFITKLISYKIVTLSKKVCGHNFYVGVLYVLTVQYVLWIIMRVFY